MFYVLHSTGKKVALVFYANVTRINTQMYNFLK